MRGGLAVAMFGLAIGGTATAAADFRLLDLEGKEQRLSDYRGKWVVVNYWATWCQPCREELPELEIFHIAAPYGALMLRVDATPGTVIVSELQSHALLAVAERRRLTAQALESSIQLAEIQVGAPMRLGVRGHRLEAGIQHVGPEPLPDGQGEACYPLSVALSAPAEIRLSIGEPVVIRSSEAP